MKICVCHEYVVCSTQQTATSHRLPEPNPELIRQVSGLHSQVQPETVHRGDRYRIGGCLAQEMLADSPEVILPNIRRKTHTEH